MRRMITSLMLLALALISFAADQIEVYPESSQDLIFLNKGIALRDYGLHPYDSSSYGESWFFVAYDAQMNSVWGLLSVSNYHPFEKMASTIDINYYEGEKSWWGHGEYKKEDTNFAMDKFDVTIGGNRAYGKYPTFYYKLKEQNVEMDLKFEAKLPSSQAGGGKIYFFNRKQFWADGVIAPYADVSGTILVDGQTKTFKGFGYADHGYSTIKIPTFSKHWHIVRAFDGQNTINIIQMETKERFQPRTIGHLLYGYDGKIYCNSPDYKFVPIKTAIEPKTKFSYPVEYELSYSGPNVQLAGKVSVKKIIETVDVLKVLSAPVRIAVKALYSNAYQFRYIGEVDLKITRGEESYNFVAPCVGEIHFY